MAATGRRVNVSVRQLTGAELAGAIDDLARLRITVFAEWPYLYDGDAAYEADYLKEFAEAPGAVLVAACDGQHIVGAATASPMQTQKPQFREPFEQRGIATDDVFYFGESVLLGSYRGQGIGHAFFDHREAQARRCGASVATFAAVVRAPDHPACPAGYSPLEPFWRKRGYAPIEGLTTQLAWKEHGEVAESFKAMQYWMRSL